MAVHPRQSKHMSKHSQESQSYTRFPTGNFFRWRTRISTDHTALALSALENCSAKHAEPDWYEDNWEYFHQATEDIAMERMLRQKNNYSNISDHLGSIWECSSICSEPTKAAEHWRELHYLHVHTLPGPQWYLFLLTADSTPSQDVPIQGLQERESIQTRNQRSSLNFQELK